MHRNDAKVKTLHCLASDCSSALMTVCGVLSSAEDYAVVVAVSTTRIGIYPGPTAAEGVWKGRPSGCVRKR